MINHKRTLAFLFYLVFVSQGSYAESVVSASSDTLVTCPTATSPDQTIFVSGGRLDNGIRYYNFSTLNINANQELVLSEMESSGLEHIVFQIDGNREHSRIDGDITVKNSSFNGTKFMLSNAHGITFGVSGDLNKSHFSSGDPKAELFLVTLGATGMANPFDPITLSGLDATGDVTLDHSLVSEHKIFVHTSTLGIKNDSRLVGGTVNGSVSVNARNSIELTNNGIISVSAATGDVAGKLSIESPQLTLDNSHLFVQTSGTGTQEGKIELSVDRLDVRNLSSISVSSLAEPGIFEASGGDISVEGRNQQRADLIILDDSSKIFAKAKDGKGGNISIKTELFLGSRSNIDASSERGSDGIVNLSVLETDAVPSTQVLTTEFKNDLGLNDRPCQQHVNKSASQFFVKGRAGLAPSPDGLLMAKNSGIRIKAGEFVRVTQVTESMVDYADGKKGVLLDCGKS